MRKTAYVLIMVLLVGLALAGCGKTKDQDPVTDTTAEAVKNDIRVQIGPSPETLDPALNTTEDGGNMIIHAFETLLTFDEKNVIVSGQAESYDISEDGLVYTFHLKEGLKWSDGSALKAGDFVYSWRRLADPATGAPYAYDMLAVVKGFEEACEGDLDALGVSAPDDLTLVVELSAPCVYFDKIVTHASMAPVKQSVIEENGEKWALDVSTYIGNGPLKMLEWAPGSHITFARNEHYWNADKVVLDRLKFVLMEDDNASYSAYLAGELDMTCDIPTDEMTALRERKDFYLRPRMSTNYVQYNTVKEPFDNPDVRMALSLAIDRNYLSETVMLGISAPAANFVGPGISDEEPGSSFEEVTRKNNGGDFFDLENHQRDLDKAKELLSRAGYPGGEGFPVVEYMTNEAGFNKVIAEYLQSAWKELGITLDIKIAEWSTFSATRRNGDFEIARGGWVYDYDDPSNMLNLMETGNGNNAGKYSNPELDALLDEARVTSDRKTHYQKLHEAENIILRDQPIAPLTYSNDYYLQSPRLKGTWYSPYGYWYFMYGYLE